jgi:hypothetical protein
LAGFANSFINDFFDIESDACVLTSARTNKTVSGRDLSRR